MKMNLKFCMRTAFDCNETRHPLWVMRELGINYHHATLQSTGDQWWFWNCKGNLENMPSYLSPLKLRPHDCIGMGLSQEMAEELLKEC